MRSTISSLLFVLACVLSSTLALPTIRDNRHFSMMKVSSQSHDTPQRTATETRSADAQMTYHPAPAPERAHEPVVHEVMEPTSTTTNAARISQGLPIKAPRRRFDASRTVAKRATTSSTPTPKPGTPQLSEDPVPGYISQGCFKQLNCSGLSCGLFQIGWSAANAGDVCTGGYFNLNGGPAVAYNPRTGKYYCAGGAYTPVSCRSTTTNVYELFVPA